MNTSIIKTNEEALRVLSDKDWRIAHLYKIKTKDRRLATFKRNRAQSDYNKHKSGLDIIVKARQHGFSTDGLIDKLDETIMNKNTNTAILAHEKQKVQTLFEIVKRAYANMPEALRPRSSLENRNEIYFPDLDSKIYVTMDTRSEMVHNLHVSEVAFIKNADERMAATLESVPKGGTVTFESTANGTSGYFHDEYNDPKSKYTKHFYNWLWSDDYQLQTFMTIDELQAEYHELAIKYGTIADIFDRFELTKEQFAWYIDKLKVQKHLMMQEYPTTDIEAFIASGRNIFHMTDIQKHSPLNAIDRRYGELLIWEQPMKGFKYVIGCDTAEGFGGDNSVIEVMNAHTGEQAAEYASNRIPPDELGGLLMEIGKYYNNALIVVEYNNSGISTVNAIKGKYMNLYRREQYDKVTNRKIESVGWRTTGTTKPLLIDNLEEAIRLQSVQIRSSEALKEMRTFVRTDEQGKQGYGAEGSNKDDRVMALGLALQGFKNVPRFKMPKTIAEQKLDNFIEGRNIPKSDVLIETVNDLNRRVDLHPIQPRYKIRGIER